MIPPAVFAILLFIVVIFLIMSNKIDHTVAVMIGAVLALLYFASIWSSWRAFQISLDPSGVYAELPVTFNLSVLAHYFTEWVDLGTIIVIFSMMIITEISKDSGLFQFIAVNAIKFSKGAPRRLLIILCLLTFAMTTVLTQITTILIVGSLTFVACDALEQNPTPFLISEAVVANVAGISTAISSMPNMLIVGASELPFVWFVMSLLPLALILLAVTLVLIVFLFKDSFSTPDNERVQDLMSLDAWTMVTEPRTFYVTAILLVGLIVGFIVFGSIGLTYIVALVGALAFILLSRVDLDPILQSIEWKSIVFFLCLFLTVGLLEEFYVFEAIGHGVLNLTAGNPFITVTLLIWITGLTSGLVDNIPVTLTFIPVIFVLGGSSLAISMDVLWISLAAGAVLGGCLTPIASSANVLAVNLSKREGHSIPYSQFLKTGIVVTLSFLAISTLYVLTHTFLQII
jgi:Na+/H+ antiporter NhaD/arsenite permease-like protein